MTPRVMVLSTLHQFHDQVACYDFAALERIIIALSPDVLLLEVSEEDLRTRADESIKQEYPRVVYPLLDALGLPAHPLEPSGAVRKELIRRKREAERPLRESGQYGSILRCGARGCGGRTASLAHQITCGPGHSRA